MREVGTAWTDQTQVLSDLGSRKRGEEPVNWQFCQHGQRNERMIVERIFSLITVVNHLKIIFHRVEEVLDSTLWLSRSHAQLPDGKLSIAQFSL